MIKVLSQNLINQIAAGEVIERPASVIKELVENSIDAGSTDIQIHVQDAGKSLISVSDNGCGMNKEALKICILNHATSKLSDENLFDIHTFGFRGEALPSMVSIARVSITSSDNDNGEAWKLNTEGKENLELEIESRKRGTTVTVKDLFYATPARLKFLKSDTTENDSCQQALKQLALAFKNITFTLYDNDKKKFHFEATNDLKTRIQEIFGKEFAENLVEVKAQRDDFSLYGFVGVPTFNKPSAHFQYFYVNNRFVKDKIFSLALRSAFAGLIPPKRYPVSVLFLDMPYDAVDVNAHPAKVEVRFKEAERIRNFLISSLKKVISEFGSTIPSTEIVNEMYRQKNPGLSSENLSSYNRKEPINSFRPNSEPRSFPSDSFLNYYSGRHSSTSSKQSSLNLKPSLKPSVSSFEPQATSLSSIKSNNEEVEAKETELCFEKAPPKTGLDLGQAIYQIAKTYIVAVNEDSLIIVDQHAAAERITLEKLKKSTKLDSQDLLIPEVCPLSETQVELFEKNSELLRKFGIVYEKLSADVISVQALPAILGSCEAKPLINDVAEELEQMGDIYSLEEQIHLILSTISCHGSLRAGRSLSIEEMNSLLRQMENTENIAQCCHGRPSYVVLSNKNLRKFFERT